MHCPCWAWSLGVGLVVDDAIVVVEAIEAKIEQGRTPREAALEAMDEVGGALVGIALVLSAVFIPAGFMAGITGSLGPPVRSHNCVLGNPLGLQCVYIESCGEARCRSKPRSAQPSRGPLARFFRLFNPGFARVQSGYVSVSGLLIRRALVAIAT